MNLWEKIKAFFNTLLRQFKAFISEVFSVSTQMLIAELKEFAVTTVANLSLQDLTNDQKRAEAIARIKAEALTKGQEIGDSLAATIVELAYQYFKNNNE